MDWLKKKILRAFEKKERLVLSRERGAMLLEDLIECCDGKSNPIKFYSADQIIKATGNLSYSNYVPLQSRSEWYSGKNENDDKIFFKKSADVRCLGEHTFSRDIAISSMVSDHKNFLRLLGCFLECEDIVSVYHGEKKLYQVKLEEKPWKRRMKIAEDIATALAYLHTAFPRPFVYRNMSIENILLDEDGVAKLIDFSYCLSIPEGFTFVNVNLIGGSVYSYMDPNYRMHGVISEKTDVFAIGILMQKCLIGEGRFHDICVEKSLRWGFKGHETKWGMNFSNFFSSSMDERIMEEIADPEMLEKMGDISEEELCRMKSFLMLSQRCIGVRGEVPTMVEVVKELKKIQRSL